uniref:Uncharacterized protein n=1 Tax=Aplanochytrium stocchinoi TaxID=215587 RepID=A0A7S3PGP9_9STRA|mmetsp:Transcript_1938/g.2499  ORF Transcript_1938/g.2499 Transcript_1938/m.2499 type:complete len:262 (+) Transcript_1938:773-1558(+)
MLKVPEGHPLLQYASATEKFLEILVRDVTLLNCEDLQLIRTYLSLINLKVRIMEDTFQSIGSLPSLGAAPQVNALPSAAALAVISPMVQANTLTNGLANGLSGSLSNGITETSTKVEVAPDAIKPKRPESMTRRVQAPALVETKVTSNGSKIENPNISPIEELKQAKAPRTCKVCKSSCTLALKCAGRWNRSSHKCSCTKVVKKNVKQTAVMNPLEKKKRKPRSCTRCTEFDCPLRITCKGKGGVQFHSCSCDSKKRNKRI